MNLITTTFKAMAVMFAVGAAAGAGVVAGNESAQSAFNQIKYWAEQRRLKKAMDQAVTIEHEEITS
jgi:hypothetical protein